MVAALKTWQVQCVSIALQQLWIYTPTIFISFAKPLLELAKNKWLRSLQKTSLTRDYRHHPLLCAASFCQVIEGFRSTFATELNRRLDGLIGAICTGCRIKVTNLTEVD